MKLISLNIEGNLHNKSVLEFLKKEKADIICLQEFLEEDVGIYKKELNFESAYQAFGYWISKNYPQFVGKKQGVVIFAKNISKSGSIFYIGDGRNVSKPFEEHIKNENLSIKNKALVWADVRDNDGNLFRFVTTQLPDTDKGEVTPYQLEIIDLFLAQLAHLGEFVLCGDINAPRGHESFYRLAKNFKDNIPPNYTTSIDQNLHRTKGIQFVVDCLLTTPVYKATNVKLADGISDHMAIVANIERY